MADVSLFGVNPSAHHATNLLLHTANTLLLFSLLRRLTGSSRRSAWVAAVFAVHPAHVESVAWIAERKDLLCAAFWLATSIAYVRWVRGRGAARYLLVLLLFSAGLLSKPMIVSLPLVFLLLDDWPLGRLRADGKSALLRLRRPDGSPGPILEKVPLFLLAGASSIVTYFVQRAGGAVGSIETYPLWVRFGNAAVACVRYLGMLFWPARLAVFYPHPGTTLSAGAIFGSSLLLVLISVSVVLLRRRAPYLFLGWSWFLVTLVPVIGIVQVGRQALADRYTYIPFIGLFVAIAWGVPEVVSARRFGRTALAAAAVSVVLVLSLAAAAQARVWKNSETLYLNAIQNTKDNFVAYNNLGEHYNTLGRPAEARKYLEVALKIHPDRASVVANLGVSDFRLGRLDEALEKFSQALRLGPLAANSWNNLARTQFLRGEVSESIRLYERVLALAPESPEVRKSLALALLMEGHTAAALEQVRGAIAQNPSDAESLRLLQQIPAFERDRRSPAAAPLRQVLATAHLDASVALYRRDGKSAASAREIERALDLEPQLAEARNELGTRLVREGRLDDAEAEFRSVLRISPEFALAQNNLGYVFFLKGQKEAAIGRYREALRLQPDFPLARENLEMALRGEGAITPKPR
jgi:tetratricopeptide (TPR) repeat protein